MSNEEKKEKIEETLKKQDVFLVKDVTDSNFKPHPYTIGPKHITASDGILDERVMKSVKCAHPKCNLSYEEHTSDKVCFLQLKRNATNEEVSEVLKSLVDTLGENFLDGFTFIETTEKFRIK